MSEFKVMVTCGVCGAPYQQGPHRYEGHKLALYGIFCCESCWQGNWDGWAPHYEPILLAHLTRHGLPAPKRNEKDLLPRS